MSRKKRPDKSQPPSVAIPLLTDAQKIALRNAAELRALEHLGAAEATARAAYLADLEGYRMVDLLDFFEDINGEMTLKPHQSLCDLPPQHRRALKKIVIDERIDGSKKVTVELHDRLKILEIYGKYLRVIGPDQHLHLHADVPTELSAATSPATLARLSSQALADLRARIERDLDRHCGHLHGDLIDARTR